MAKEYFQRVSKSPGFGEDYIENTTLLFSYIRENSGIFLLMHNARLDYKMFELFRAVFPLNYDYGKAHRYYLDFQASGYLSVITDWILSGMKEADEYMGKLVAEIVENSTIN